MALLGSACAARYWEVRVNGQLVLTSKCLSLSSGVIDVPPDLSSRRYSSVARVLNDIVAGLLW